MKRTSKVEFKDTWRDELSDYIQAIAWCPLGRYLAASSAAGEVALFSAPSFETLVLQEETGLSVDCLGFSHDGQFFAIGGQDGGVRIWSLASDTPELTANLDNKSAWVDCLSWSPITRELAFSLGKYVQVWQADKGEVVTTLSFGASSVLDLAWSCDGRYLAVAGYQGTKVWQTGDWDAEEEVLESSSATVAIAWSLDSKFIAQGNLDNTLTVTAWGNPYPWLMQGFPGKVRQLAWSLLPNKFGLPLLASCSGTAVVVWEKDADEKIGWNGRILGNHEATVRAIAFQPDSLVLASTAEDGWIALWDRKGGLNQTLMGAIKGFSCLAWHPQGHQLAAGGANGEILVWSQTMRGRGFGK
jgi:WD40 repeat protein